MAETRTGLNPWLSETGTAYVHELVRQASRIASELVEPATTGIPREVTLTRSQIAVAANTALGINSTTNDTSVTVEANYFQKTVWGEEQPGTVAPIRKADRVLILKDVPAFGGQLADKVLLTDVIAVDDPEFGVVNLEIKKVTPLRGTGMIHVEAVYHRK